MDDVQAEFNIDKQFEKDCLGQKVCSLFIDYNTMFSEECREEIQRRNAGNIYYGPPKVYAIAQCKSNVVNM